MHIVAVTNIKGGVGKTTTCVNLAYLSAASGVRTLLWDLDPQGAASYLLRREGAARASAKKLISGERDPLDVIVSTDHDHLDLLPADFSYRKFDLHLGRQNFPTEWLLKMRRPLSQACDTLFMDCPAGISLLSENILRVADVIITPLVPTPLSLRMLTQLRTFLDAEGWSDIKLLPVFSLVDRRRSLHLEVIASARAAFPSLLATEIPYSSEIERMSVRCSPLPRSAPRSAGSQTFASLWAEIVAQVPALKPRPQAKSPAESGQTVTLT